MIGMQCTRHRLFLATLIVAAKYLNDSSPKNKHWTRYGALFSQAEVNLMEKQLLYLLDYDLRIEEDELMVHLSPFFRLREEKSDAGRREMYLRGCAAGRERERYARASESRVYLRSLPADQVPAWNMHKEQDVEMAKPRSSSFYDAPPSPESPMSKGVDTPYYHTTDMYRQDSVGSTSSGVSSEAELTDDNGSSSSSIEEDFDEEEEEAYQVRRGMSATHIAAVHIAKERENAIMQNARLRSVASQERLPSAVQRLLPGMTKSQSSAGYDGRSFASQQHSLPLPPQAGPLRSSRSSSNLLSRMLSSAH
jgi:G1/S-specific cyclin PLC1